MVISISQRRTGFWGSGGARVKATWSSPQTGTRGRERNGGRDTETVDQGAMDRSVGETEIGDTFLDLKKQPASKSPHHYTENKDFSSGMRHRHQCPLY